jgi:hypothetical protein
MKQVFSLQNHTVYICLVLLASAFIPVLYLFLLTLNTIALSVFLFYEPLFWSMNVFLSIVSIIGLFIRRYYPQRWYFVVGMILFMTPCLLFALNLCIQDSKNEIYPYTFFIIAITTSSILLLSDYFRFKYPILEKENS